MVSENREPCGHCDGGVISAGRVITGPAPPDTLPGRKQNAGVRKTTVRFSSEKRSKCFYTVSFSLLSVRVTSANSYGTGLNFNTEIISLEESMTLLTFNWKIHRGAARPTGSTRLPTNI